MDTEWRRTSALRKILERTGPFLHPDYDPSPEILKFINQDCKILVIGAGGLGCEFLKNLALIGFRQIDIIDMDIIDLSNLNRQFLFRRKDIGQSKAEVAAKFVNERVPGCNITPHFCKIQDKDESFYRQFTLVLCGLDSIVARRWINGMLVSLLVYEGDTLDQTSVIPMVDGGTEGFKGNVRVIYPGMNACIECTLDLYPPQITYPLCTIANTPRLPEHCVEYVKVIQWPKDNPFDCQIDGDDPQHISWIYEKSNERALQFGIKGLTYRLVQGVVKNIIPAVASTNAVIASICCTEIFKLATGCCLPLNNYMVFSNTSGIYNYNYEAERNPECLVCSQRPKEFRIENFDIKLKDLIEELCTRKDYQMKNPAISGNINGKNKTFYLHNIPSIEEKTRDNLILSLKELGLQEGSEIVVADETSPNSIVFQLKSSSTMESE